jgi:hypothetical protein
MNQSQYRHIIWSEKNLYHRPRAEKLLKRMAAAAAAMPGLPGRVQRLLFSLDLTFPELPGKYL